MIGAKWSKVVTSCFSLITLTGVGSAGMGIWSKLSSESTEVLKGTVDDTNAWMIQTALRSSSLLIAGGSFLFIIGLVGCCGTLKKKSWMLLVVFFVVLIVFILQITWAVFTLLPNSVKEKLETKIVQGIEKSYTPDTAFTGTWDKTMKVLECCGYKGYNDFTNSTFVKKKQLYPIQCCDPENPCTEEAAKRKNVKGCYEVLLKENIPASGTLSFLMGIVEIVAMVVSLKVYGCLRRIPFP
ncbi:tetraspanin-1-like [Xyrauchen texanus]|uniref:tetraspanin-1-like n=1 Tax=Xyrauchen texanus TaxID=154827 RepID=UPI0022418FE3|nr:tetraspanin-1-like [Xyrauchen texanus]